MTKWVCRVCGYVHEGQNPPETCPICKAVSAKFDCVKDPAGRDTAEKPEDAVRAPKREERSERAGKTQTAASSAGERGAGRAQVIPESLLRDLRQTCNGECEKAGMYMAMAGAAFREGYPEIGLYYERAGREEAEHAAKFAKMLGETVTDSTGKNLRMSAQAQERDSAGMLKMAERAGEAGLDAFSAVIREIAQDEAAQGSAFRGLLDRFFPE